RIAFVCEFPTRNGGEQSLLAVLDALRGSAGTAAHLPLEAVFLAPPAGPLAEAVRARGLPVIPFECRNADGQRRPQDQLVDEIVQESRRSAVDLLHANSLSMSRLT